MAPVKKRKVAKSLTTLFDQAALQRLNDKPETADDHIQRYFRSIPQHFVTANIEREHHTKNKKRLKQGHVTSVDKDEDQFSYTSSENHHRRISIARSGMKRSSETAQSPKISPKPAKKNRQQLPSHQTDRISDALKRHDHVKERSSEEIQLQDTRRSLSHQMKSTSKIRNSTSRRHRGVSSQPANTDNQHSKDTTSNALKRRDHINERSKQEPLLQGNRTSKTRGISSQSRKTTKQQLSTYREDTIYNASKRLDHAKERSRKETQLRDNQRPKTRGSIRHSAKTTRELTDQQVSSGMEPGTASRKKRKVSDQTPGNIHVASKKRRTNKSQSTAQSPSANLQKTRREDESSNKISRDPAISSRMQHNLTTSTDSQAEEPKPRKVIGDIPSRFFDNPDFMKQLDVIHKQLSLLREPIMFSGIIQHRYEALRNENNSGAESRTKIPENIIDKAFTQYNKKLLRHHHKNSETAEVTVKKVARILSQKSFEQTSDRTEDYWKQASRDLNFKCPREIPPQCCATRTQFDDYNKIRDDIRALQNQREKKINVLQCLLKIVQQLDQLKKADKRYLSLQHRNAVTSKQHALKLSSALSDAKSIAMMLLNNS